MINSAFFVIICATSFALAQSAKSESSWVAVTVSLTSNTTATAEEQRACLADVRQICPTWHPLFCPGVPFPAPFTGFWDLWNLGEGLLPDKGCDELDTLDMLE